MNPIVIVAAIILAVPLAIFLRPRLEQWFNRVRPKPKLTDVSAWTIGPIANGENTSRNMPLHPGDGFVIDLPRPDCQPHYVTINHGPLTGKTRITMQGRVEGGPIFAHDGVSQASLCLYFQRQFDDWMATESAPPKDSDTEGFRWYATSSAILPIVEGPFEISAAFTDKWTAVLYSDSLSKPSAFKAAMDNAGEVGFVLGGGDGWGHGIMATSPAKIIVTSFEVA